jgi:hypothetical protein
MENASIFKQMLKMLCLPAFTNLRIACFTNIDFLLSSEAMGLFNLRIVSIVIQHGGEREKHTDK